MSPTLSPIRSGEPAHRSTWEEAFADWLQTPLGKALLDYERAALDAELRSLFGVSHLEICTGQSAQASRLVNCGHRMVALPAEQAGMEEGSLICRREELPFPDDSIDVLVLHHTLDFTPQPHQCLRECSRVLRGGGHLLLVGFNPFSWWGLRRLVANRRLAPWHGRFLSRYRVEDWLSLLDFAVGDVRFHFFRPPVQSPRLLGRLAFLERPGLQQLMPGGAVYTVVAEKRVGAMIRLKPRWERQKVVALPLANRSRALQRDGRSL